MKKLDKKGFTLMELIIVIAIIAVLMLILVPTMGGFVDTARDEANLANAKAAYTAAVAQQTAADAGLGYDDLVDGTCTEIEGKTWSNLSTDFYDSAESESCTIDVTTNDGKVTVDSATYASVTYPDDAD